MSDARPLEFEPDLGEVGERLERERPAPGAAFRGELGRSLVEMEGRMTPLTRPATLRRRIAGLAGSGAVLLALAGAGVLGLGPMAA